MTLASLLPDGFAASLAHAVIRSSDAPMVLLSADATVLAVSKSFCRAFGIDLGRATMVPFATLGHGEWDIPQLDVLLRATASGEAEVANYETDLKRPGQADRCLSISARRLDYSGDARPMVLVSITDITDSRARDRQKDALVREKAVLLEELRHRVANSLQIIASVLLQSAKRVQSDETRTHLYDAHQRVMSVAELQQQLAVSQVEDVELGRYLTQLCRSIGASMVRDRDALAIKVDADGSVVEAGVSLSLGLIVTELVINALKHAFPGQRGGTIVVGYRATGDGWDLTVRDDGVGMPDNPDDAKAGLGSSIVRALAVQLDASVASADAGPGTLVTIAHREAAVAAKVPLAV